MRGILLTLLLLTFCSFMDAQTNAWYDSAQVRIDTLRKGRFTFKVVDHVGQGIQDSIKIIHKKHEFPWGTSIDLNYNVGNNYTSSQPITAPADSEVYRTERWASTLAYYLPAIKNQSYRITLKLSENYFSSANSRLFDVYIDGQRVMQNIDKYALAGGQYKAFDTTVHVTALSENIKLEFMATKDNVAVMGIVLSDGTGTPVLRLNCSGKDITTKSGNLFVSDLIYLDKSSPADNWIKAVMLKYCNYGVSGNQFKWSGIEPNHRQLNYAPFENTLSWFNKVGWDMRAHTLLWGGNNSTDYHCLPQWVMALSSNPKAMYDTCKMRVIREVSRYKGIIREYDVLNEPTHANYLQKIVGDSINWNCFKWAHEADPDARLFINDYNIIEWQDQTDNFVALVRKMLQNGAPITGIGAQCHIGSSVDIPNFKKRFDQLGQFGLPIKITEFDMGAKSLTQVQYATEISKMMRLAFSHPKIEGFVFWGLTEPTWVPETIVNLIREDKTAKIAADSVYRLIHDVWSTKLSGMTDASGMFHFKGYFGDYDVLVKVGGTWKKYAASCKKADSDKVIEINAEDGVSPGPVLKNARIISPVTIELTFDKPMADPSNEIRNFMVFDTVTNGFQSAVIKPGDSNTIVLRTRTALLTNKSLIPVSYYPGNQISADGGLLESIGPVYLKGYLSSFLSSKTTSDGRRIAIRFNKKLIDSTINISNFSVKVNSVNNPITGAILSESKDTLFLTLSGRIVKTTDLITVAYQMNSLLTFDGYFVKGFSKSVTNSIGAPAYTFAFTNSNGKSIGITFSGQLADTSVHMSDFTVKVNNNIDLIDQVSLSATHDTVFLTISAQIVKSSDIVTVTYKPGLLISADSLYVAGFTNKIAANRVLVPAIISAATDNEGASIRLGFSQNLADPAGQEASFSVLVNSVTNAVSGAELVPDDSKKIILTLSSVIHMGDTVSISYTPGMLESAIDVPVAAFSSVVVNNSTVTPTGLERTERNNPVIYPNPFADKLLVRNADRYTTVTISDMFGKNIMQTTINRGANTTINTAELASGVYLIILSNQRDQLIQKILKQ